MSTEKKEKTLIGVLASHDSCDKNRAIAVLLDDFARGEKNQSVLEQFGFVFTGGTFDRIILGVCSPEDDPCRDPLEEVEGIIEFPIKVKDDTREFLLKNCGILRLPSSAEGGVIFMSYLIVKQITQVIWPFLTPVTMHWLNPADLALARLCDSWRVKRLMNSGSVKQWFEIEAKKDVHISPQEWPPSKIPLSSYEPSLAEGDTETFIEILQTKGRAWDHTSCSFYKLGNVKRQIVDDSTKEPYKDVTVEIDGRYQLDIPPAFMKGNVEERREVIKNMTITLIAHDQMKDRMVEFVVDYQQELGRFRRILTTGTTGKKIGEAAPSLKKNIVQCHSGPKGGDIEIATEILLAQCDVGFFFVDSLNAHPHIDDIRVVFGASMIQDQVRMISNERQARDWVDTVIRGK